MPPLKRTITAHLEGKQYDALLSIKASNHRLINALISLSYDKTSVLSWRAIEAVGRVTREIAASDPDKVRNIVGRLLWMIRDESGGIGWSCPEMLGEIVRNNPLLCADIAPIITSFHEEKMLVSGVLWAVGRIGQINDETVGYAIPIVLQYLGAADDTLRGYAALALGSLGALGALPRLESMAKDPGPVPVYSEGELLSRSVGQIASEAVQAIRLQHSS